MQRDAMQCNVMQCDAMQHNTQKGKRESVMQDMENRAWQQ